MLLPCQIRIYRRFRCHTHVADECNGSESMFDGAFFATEICQKTLNAISLRERAT